VKRILIALSSFALCGVALFGQEQAQQPQVINIHVARTIQAVNYQARGSTHIDFRGTALLPQAKGEAKIDSKAANVSIEAKFENLSPATQFGSVYLTYVLWAISPEGRANNLGQLTLDGSRSKVKVTTRLQTFGLIVTAEPYFSVSVPSEEVVLENMATSETQGKVDVVEAKYELLQRGRYNNANLPPLNASSDVSLELLQARNAMRIAQWRRADKYAPESWAKAQDALTRAEDFQTRKQRKSVATVAREAVQGFEDAITISLKRQEDERLAQEREASSQREAQARAEREAESQRRADAEKQKLQSDVNAARDAQARAEAEKGQAEAERQKAEADKEKAEAERLKAEAQANQQQALDQAEQARQAALRSEQEQQRLRATLLEQFNRILETRDTVRGLVVNLGDVLFTTAKYDLRPEARERLAKLAGIVLAHPGLNLAVEGHTDNVGSDTYNQTLSEQRAASVRAYLIAQGLEPNSITTAGYGKGQPVADNSTATGRQKNRRVEIVVSGEVIGVKIGTKPAGNQQ
jgi:outer membrane protein OmpA-like peptidoglycan-associated protein